MAETKKRTARKSFTTGSARAGQRVFTPRRSGRPGRTTSRTPREEIGVLLELLAATEALDICRR